MPHTLLFRIPNPMHILDQEISNVHGCLGLHPSRCDRGDDDIGVWRVWGWSMVGFSMPMLVATLNVVETDGGRETTEWIDKV